VVFDDDLARFVLASYQPRLRHVPRCGRSVPSVVSSPWPGCTTVASSKRSKILLSRSFIKVVKFSGLLVLPGPPGNTRARCPMVKFGAVHVPHQAQGLGGSLGHGSSRQWDRVRVLDIRVLDAPCP